MCNLKLAPTVLYVLNRVNRVCEYFKFALPNTNKILQSTSIDINGNHCIDDMGPTKEEVKTSEIEATPENEDAETASGSNTPENEIENEDRPLHIDTNDGGDSKVESLESERIEKTNDQENGKKRSSDSDSNPTPTKKVRNKPKPQIIENMQEYVDNNTIEKLTTTTLLHWLKERSLHCSTRDKKAELIQKIKNHFVPTKT